MPIAINPFRYTFYFCYFLCIQGEETTETFEVEEYSKYSTLSSEFYPFVQDMSDSEA